MGLYRRYVLPRLIDLAMRDRRIRVERERLVPLASGRVIEIGFGSGLNVPFYGRHVERLAAIDPSAELWKLARRRVEGAAFPVEFRRAPAEAIPFADASFDTAVMTWTLCSVPDPAGALREIRRVLTPRGRLLFVEHGRSPDRSVRAWQDRLTPCWKRIAGGCELNRDIRALMASAGFRFDQLEQGYGETPRVFGYLSRGVATPDRRDVTRHDP